MCAIQNQSSLPENVIFDNRENNQHNLLSKSNLVLQHMYTNAIEENIAEHIFNPNLSANHIFREYKKEKLYTHYFLSVTKFVETESQ